ncbi:MAG TPA: CBS domain-containing protein [Gaiellaceae bacterium]|nr:CBS domain-containing protein [Gaiellaceae bacterium]
MSVISDHMSRELLKALPDESIAEAARRMVERGVGAALVMEGDRLEGILTERDILKAVAMGLTDNVRVRDWMTRNPETIEASDSTGHAAALMIHGGFRHLPVLDGGAIVGIVSIRDLMRVTLDDSSPRGV